MIVLGIILLVVGLLLPALHLLFIIGIILLVIGLVLLLLGSTGHSVAGRRHYWQVAWALARVGFLIVGTCALGAVLGAIAATALDLRDELRAARTPRQAATPPAPGAHWRRDHRDG